MVENEKKLFIPSIGDKIILTKNWSFDLFDEYRNRTAIKKALTENQREELQRRKSNNSFSYCDKIARIVIPKFTVLTIRRIYIRQGAKDFDSLTFSIFKTSDKKFKSFKFWAKLYDVNNIIFVPFEENLYKTLKGEKEENVEINIIL